LGFKQVKPIRMTMKNNRLTDGPAAMVARLLAVLMLMLSSIDANAVDCPMLYSQSGAIPGTSDCPVEVAGNTPGGMGNYACLNDMAGIRAWCASGDRSGDETCPVSDPVFPATGKVILSEQDFASGDTQPLTFTRTYLSKPFDASAPSSMGQGWANNWERRLDLSASSGPDGRVTAYRSDRQPVVFRQKSGRWVAAGRPWLSLWVEANGFWSLKDQLTGTTETYGFGNGGIYSETTRTGVLRQFGFDSRNRMVQINQRAIPVSGLPVFKIRLEYDDSDRIVKMTDPVGNVTQYGYDAKGNLVSATRPDGFVRQYLYDDARLPNALTGVKDESGSRIATWTYDAQGRAATVTHPDSTRNASFSYGNGKTTVTDMYGATTFNFGFNGLWRSNSIAALDGTTSRTWNATGSLKQKTMPNGNVQYSWDNANRPTKATATLDGKTTVTTIEYSDATTLEPHLVATPGKIRAFDYDARGNVTGYAEQQTTDLTGELGMNAAKTGSLLTVGSRYDSADRLLSATIVSDGTRLESWTYTYDAMGNIASAQDAVSGWSMTTLERDAADRATVVSGNTGKATISYDKRGRVSEFVYDEKASIANGGLARLLTVRYGYSSDGSVASRSATVAKNGGGAQAISDAELDVWLTNWELGNDPVSPPANLTGLQSDAKAFVSRLCVECYMAWKAKLTGKLFDSELSDTLPKWSEATELMLSDQSQIPYPVLVPDLTSSAKRTMLYSALFGSGSGDGGMVKCGSRGHDEWLEAHCHAKYESDMRLCASIAYPMGGKRGVALCKQQAFLDYQECRGN
jgi:YD repeat-containing protein